MQKSAFPFVFPHVVLGNEKKAHGRNENKEKAGGESLLSLPAFFYRFPRMHSIRLAVFHTAQPVGGRQWRIQFSKFQSFICENLCA